jgi:hypothetical protein
MSAEVLFQRFEVGERQSRAGSREQGGLFVVDYIEESLVSVFAHLYSTHIMTDDNLADNLANILTKALPKPRHEDLVWRLGMA